ncbi:hypothetical protein ANCCAN_01017 [Ancylostoma caninum]|uniref:SXP/RAL-2 family protein Ani s 5-like cation-binding domain-containing protein n=1 Tax=Ancylostoma caninum TaxID=29170 RepID=A0A368HC98_ANCCA|nr:hypothetical protein ANCCAN_01017 [Ancylostoma caninum]
MKLALLISIAVTVTYCKGPVFVEELEALVKTKKDKLALRRLAEDVYMTRSEKSKRLGAILSHLPKDLQNKYKDAVNKEKQKIKKHLQLQKAAAKKWGYARLLSKVEAIDTDMSISDSEAEKLEVELVKTLTPTQHQYYEEMRIAKKGKAKRKAGNACGTSISLVIFSACVFIFR